VSPLDRYWDIVAAMELPGLRITLVDPDEPAQRNVYEDLDAEPGSPRLCLVLLYPEHARALARGEDPSDDQEVVTHERAIADINRLLDLGWQILAITPDRRVRGHGDQR
jgi:hypothetical protein